MAESSGPYYRRDLSNYKEMHKNTAKDRGVYEQFMNCTTLSRARTVLFGKKVKKPTHSTGK